MQKLIVIPVLFCLMSLTHQSVSQTLDYGDFAHLYRSSCGATDTNDVLLNQQLLDSLSNFELTGAKGKFLYDRGWTYYMRSIIWKRPEDLDIAQQIFLDGWEQEHDLFALWNLGVIAMMKADCDAVIKHTTTFVREVKDRPEVIVDHEEVAARLNYCEN